MPQHDVSSSAGPTLNYATFFVGGQYFGIDVLKVQEVLRWQQMTRVPLAPAIVRGLINLRGQIVTAIDVREKLGLQPSTNRNESMNVVIRSSEGAISLLVDEISDVVSVNEADFEPSPQNVDVNIRKLLEGLYKLDKQLLLILDTERLLQC